jgi:AraC-like DNA-binding protein
MYKIRLKQCDLEKAKEIVALLEKEYYKHYTNKDLSMLVGSNEQTMKAAFKAITGKTVYEYLTDVRIEKAKSLLESTEMSIEIIAERVGLDRSNLNKQFRKQIGMTPARWRNENKSCAWQ